MLYIKKIESPSNQDVFRLINQLNPDLSYKQFATYLFDMMQHQYNIVGAFEDNKLVGLTGYWLATKFYCGKYLEIDNFVVDKNHRGNGIGHTIIKYVLQIACDLACEAVLLNAYIDNEAAHQFYDKYKFETIGKHRMRRILDGIPFQ